MTAPDPARCEPPPGQRHHRWHWLALNGTLAACWWQPDFASWHLAGDLEPRRPEWMHRYGWRYVGPCVEPGGSGDGK